MITHSAYSFILVHNHPSGDQNPSCLFVIAKIAKETPGVSPAFYSIPVYAREV
jgi:RadC-like JAB domain